MPLFVIASRMMKGLRRYRVRVLIMLAVAIVLLGAAAFSLTQHVSYGLALYWSVTTATTVGYGDVTPHNTAGRIVACLVMITTIPTVGAVFALVAGATVISHIRRFFGMDNAIPSEPHTVIYGTNPVLGRVTEELTRSGDTVVLVASERPTSLDEDHHFLAGDPTDEQVVRRSHPEHAQRALIAADTDADTLVTAVHVRALAPDLEIYALSQSPNVASALEDLGITHTLASDELVGHTLAKSLETPQAGDMLLSLLDGPDYKLSQSRVAQGLIGKPLSAARGQADILVLGLVRAGQVQLGVADDPVLAAEDMLITVAPEA
jgi:voltage-gated potassium channel